MSTVDFEVLKLIPKMMEEMQDLKKVLLDDRYYEILKQFKKAFNSTLTH